MKKLSDRFNKKDFEDYIGKKISDDRLSKILEDIDNDYLWCVENFVDNNKGWNEIADWCYRGQLVDEEYDRRTNKQLNMLPRPTDNF